MKKGIVVLLIAVLVAGFAFADVTEFSGSAAVSYGVGLDENAEFGFKNAVKTTFKFNFEFATAEVDNAEHSTDFWAEIGASASAGYTDSKYALEAEITKANIHVKDLTINILGPKGPYNYATSWTKNEDKEPIFDYANAFENKVGGVELLYGGYSLSIAQYKSNGKATKASDAKLANELVWISDAAWAKMTAKQQAGYKLVTPTTDPAGAYYAKYTKAADAKLATDSNNLYIGAETKAFELAEGMTAQAAANFLLVGTKTGDETKYDSKAGAGLKFNFKNEESKIKAGVAADVSYDNKTISFDVLATGSYDFVSAKAYFGFAKAEDADPEMALELSASAKYKVNDDVTVTGSVEANRLLNVKNESKYHFNEAWAGFTVKAGATVKEFTVDAYFNYNQLIDHLVVADADIFGMNAGLNVTYKAEKFTAKAGAALNFMDVLDGTTYAIKPYAIKPTASISSTALVENCTLALGWAGARFVLDEKSKEALEGSNGAITASATIAF